MLKEFLPAGCKSQHHKSDESRPFCTNVSVANTGKRRGLPMRTPGRWWHRAGSSPKSERMTSSGRVSPFPSQPRAHPGQARKPVKCVRRQLAGISRPRKPIHGLRGTSQVCKALLTHKTELVSRSCFPATQADGLAHPLAEWGLPGVLDAGKSVRDPKCWNGQNSPL